MSELESDRSLPKTGAGAGADESETETGERPSPAADKILERKVLWKLDTRCVCVQAHDVEWF
jgi:hypothetical protein